MLVVVPSRGMGTTVEEAEDAAASEGEGQFDLPPYERDDSEPSLALRVAAWAALIVGGFAFGALGAYAILRAAGKV